MVSKELQTILEKINKSLKDNKRLTKCGFKTKSLWMFRHVPQIRSFKSWGYLAIDSDVKKAYSEKKYRLKERVSEQVILEDIGSIGMAFKQEKENQDWLFVPNTYDAPEGTVVELDLRLGHQSVLFVPFKVEKDIVAILLISTAIFEEKKKPDIQKRIKEIFKNSGINELIRIAYWNERNKDVIANVKKATMDFVGTGTTTVKETMKDIVSSDITTPEVFVRKHFISPIKEFNQGISFVPIIKIEDKHHLQKPQWGYSDVVYDKLQQRLSESIKEGLGADALVSNFTKKCKKQTKFNIDLGQGCSITYVLNGNEDVGKHMESDAGCFREQADSLVEEFCERCDPKTILIIKKKYISEKLNQTYKVVSGPPFYLVLEKSNLPLETGTLTFDKELIASNLNDKTFPLDGYRKELTGENGFDNSTNYQSKLTDGLVFSVFTDKERKKEEIFNDDVKAFIDQRCLYYNLLIAQKQAKKDAVRASIAQVMARNMSHNLGSHVFSHLIKTEVYDELTDEKLKKELTEYSSREDDKVFDHQDSQKPESPLKNQQLGYFNQYLKSRMDYLSEVTFGVPTMLTSKMIYNDVFKELDRVRLLLNYISGISKFKYEFDFQHNGNSIMEGNEPDFAAAFPSDVLGCQAFYNIIENIIRNTAKHAKRTNNEKVTFTINFKDINTAGLQDIEGVNDLYCVEIDNGINEDIIDELVRKQIGRINESVLDEYNQLRGRSLGLLEMEASAAFLRQIDIPDIESDDYYVDDNEALYHKRNGVKRLNILKPFKTTKGTLGYRFFVQKPKEFLFVGEWSIINDGFKKKLRNFGIEFISNKEFCTAMTAGKTFPHQFLLYNKNIREKAKSYLCNNDCKTLLPLRKLKVDSNEVCKCCSNNQVGNNNTTEIDGNKVLQKLKDYAWKLYFQSVIKDDLKYNENTGIQIRQAFEPSSINQVIFLHHGNNENYERYWSGRTSTIQASPSLYIKHPEFKAEGWLEDLSSRTMEMLPSFRELSKIGGRKEPMSNYCLNLKGKAKAKAKAAIDTERAAALRMNIFEAYHNKVIVIDERVQRFALSNVNETNAPKGKIPVNKIFESTNVLIPETKLDPTSFDGNAINELDSFVMENLENAFVLVHYGVLERMYEKTDDITDKLNDWSEKAKRVVVTSGRGSHSLPLPDSVCFANLSSVLNVFVENRNKYSINYLIHQSRRKNG